jgi:uncharacterized protein YndB with AHSA1/START domain
VLKWILGGLLIIILALAGTCFVGYKKLTAGGDAISVTMATTPEALFAQIATPDSMRNWVVSSKVEGPLGRGMLVVGDTLQLGGTADVGITTRDSSGVGVTRQAHWIVREVMAPMLLVTEMRADSAGRSHVMLVRRDSLVAAGDSTTLISTFASPMFDSLTSSIADSSKIGGSILGASNKLMVGAMRLSAEMDLKNLKARLEGTTPK